MASAILREISPFLSNFKVWDPFCGSGTFLLQSMLNLSKFPIRVSNYSEVFDIESGRFFKENGYLEFIDNLKKEEQEKMKELIENKEFNLIGNDKAPTEAQHMFENLANFFKKWEKSPDITSTALVKENFVNITTKKNFKIKKYSIDSFS